MKSRTPTAATTSGPARRLANNGFRVLTFTPRRGTPPAIPCELQGAFDDLAFLHSEFTTDEFARLSTLLAGCAAKLRRAIEGDAR
jgi:hypothetical protein